MCEPAMAPIWYDMVVYISDCHNTFTFFLFAYSEQCRAITHLIFTSFITLIESLNCSNSISIAIVRGDSRYRNNTVLLMNFHIILIDA